MACSSIQRQFFGKTAVFQHWLLLSAVCCRNLLRRILCHIVQDVRRILRALDGVSGTLNATTGPLIVDLSAVALEGCIWQANRKNWIRSDMAIWW